MKVTLDEIRNILKRLDTEKQRLVQNVERKSSYVAAVTEDEKSIRPEFSLTDTASEIAAIDQRSVKIRHCRNVFNATKIVGTTGLTPDEILTRLAILTNTSRVYEPLTNRDLKTREPGYANREIEYRYLNYDPAEANEIYDRIEAERDELHEALDRFNATELLEIPDQDSEL